MKFIKNNFKIIIAFIIGVVLAGGIVYAATSASEIEYTVEGRTDINTVADALNDLYINKKISIDNLLNSSIESGDASTATTSYTNQNSKPENIIIVLNWFSSYMQGSVSKPDISITGDVSNLQYISDEKNNGNRYILNYVYSCTLAANGSISASIKGNGGASSYGGEYVSIYRAK